MVCLVQTRIGIQPLVDHYPVDKVVDNGGNIVNAPSLSYSDGLFCSCTAILLCG